jgi:hypothetical protein
MVTLEKRPLKVFLCHAHVDRIRVIPLYTRLRRAGAKVWLDKEDLFPGTNWEYEIRNAVRESDIVIVCLSKQFNQEGFRQREVRLALDTAMEKPEGEIFIIPARLEECDNLPTLIRWQWVDLFDEKNGFEKLRRSLNNRAISIGAAVLERKKKLSDAHVRSMKAEVIESDVQFDNQDQILAGQETDILKLIARGEGEELEFKSSMRYNYKWQSIDKDGLGLAIAKVLAGFMNRTRGVLLIGVSDEGEVLGIERDIETLPKKTVEGFLLAFRELVKFRLGTECLVYLKIVLKDVDGHKVCVVNIEKSVSPVYVKNGNDSEFYVRVLNATMKLSLPEAVSYIRSHWG